jgi:RNA polymerase primary sigma factor
MIGQVFLFDHFVVSDVYFRDVEVLSQLKRQNERSVIMEQKDNRKKSMAKLSEYHLRHGDRRLSGYIQQVMAAEILDKETEFSVARDIQSLEIDRWVEVLWDSTWPEVVDEALLEAAHKHCEKGSTAMLAPALKKLRMGYLPAQGAKPDTRSVEAMKQLLVVIFGIDKKRRLFENFLGLLDLEGVLDFYLSPDAIWNVANIDVCIENNKHRLVEANLWLVLNFARRYDFGLMPMADLIQEGNIGLIEAVSRFDHTRGFRFSTFAAKWIRNTIRKALARKGRIISIPANVIDVQYRVRHAAERFYTEHGRDVKETELSELTDMSVEQLRRLEKNPVVEVFSANVGIPGLEDMTLVDNVPDEKSRAPDECTDMFSWIREMTRVLEVLSSIERAIIGWRFGLDGDNALSLRQIGERHNLSGERIRQIQNSALNKLRLAYLGS